ncbi:MAG TPA: arginine N-succinyltransferase, partial [Pirellulaceae bacterium]|nr:arginine N-succinyltransferase [Pirellulaceae bacterium]
KEVIAEMRGVVLPDGRSPLWSALGAHFFQMEFPKAETLSNESKKFIADLMPEHPIYIPLLPREAQEVIGRVHPNTAPALAILRREGFEFRNLVDIFDGGPAMHAEVANIRIVKESRVFSIQEISEEVEGQELMLSNTLLDFRCALGILRPLTETTCAIDQVTALQLKLRLGDQIRAVSLRTGDAA